MSECSTFLSLDAGIVYSPDLWNEVPFHTDYFSEIDYTNQICLSYQQTIDLENENISQISKIKSKTKVMSEKQSELKPGLLNNTLIPSMFL